MINANVSIAAYLCCMNVEENMDKKIAGLLGAVAGLATMSAAQAATTPAASAAQVQPPTSYADLLAPVPNAAAQLKADDAARLPQAPARAQTAQYYFYYGPSDEFYEHHHHHHFFRPFFHHHHHHHHHAAYFALPGARGGVNKA